jgi:hypothetical protein
MERTLNLGRKKALRVLLGIFCLLAVAACAGLLPLVWIYGMGL